SWNAGCTGFSAAEVSVPAAVLCRRVFILLPLSSRASSKLMQSPRREFQPRLTLIAPLASSGSTCIARNTCEGCTFPDEQAEPDDTATPSMSKDIRSTCAGIEGRAKQDVLASLSASLPKN